MVKKQTTKKQATVADTMEQQIIDLRLEISKMSMQHAKAQLKNTTSLRLKKDELARLLTKQAMQKFAEKKEEGK